MLHMTWQGLIAHRFRLFATALAVTLGVAFTAGTLIFTDTVTRTFDTLMSDIYDDTDVVVRGVEQFEGDMNLGAQRPRVDDALLQTVRSVDGVDVAEGSVNGYARIIGSDGEPLGDPATSAPTFGFTWTSDERLNPLVIADGRAPTGDGEMVIDVGSADAGKLSVGDTTTVILQTGPEQFQVVGTARFGTADSVGGATMAVFAPQTAQRVLAVPGKWDEIAVVADEGISEPELAQRVAAALPDDAGAEVVTGAVVTKENQDFTRDAMSVFSLFMQFFAVVALLVGAFMIFNTFSITVAQRTRENGLLRALGASRRQVLAMVLVEALVVGLLASLLGLAAGYGIANGLKALLDALGFGIPAGGLVFSTRTVVVALLAGIVVTLVAALSPARKAAKVAPVAAMSSHVVGSTGYGSRQRVLVGAVVLSAGGALLLTGLFADVGQPLALVGLGTLGVFLGTSILGRTISLPLSRAIGAPLPRLRGLSGELARENAMRNPKRTAAAASALMIGVGVVGIILIFVASMRATVDEGIDRAFTGDLVVDAGASVNGGVDPGLAPRLAALPEVGEATGLRVGPAVVDGDSILIGAVDPKTAFDLIDLQPLQGSPSDLDAGSIAVFDETARDKGLSVGSTVPVEFAATGPQDLTVAMIYGQELEANGPAGDYFLSTAAYEANFTQRFDWQVYVNAAPGATVDQAKTAVQGVLTDYPGVDVKDEQAFADSITAQLDPMLALVYALLGLSIFIALLGIGNTLALSIVERTRELGLLRAVGMTRNQLRSTIRWESVVIAVQGTLLGLTIGVLVGWALVRALEEEGIDVFRIPTGSLAVVVLLGGLAGMAAAILPSRRAARLDVLRAVSAE